jgi:phospholipase/carboxylesterase
VDAPAGQPVAADQVLWSHPEGQRAGRPLLVLLHGHGMDEQMGAEVRHQLPPELVTASVRGPLRVRNGYGWYPLDASLQPQQVDQAAHAVLTWVRAQREHPSVGVLGFSQGSSIGLQCMRLAPELFGYGVVLSGFAVPLPLPGDAALARRRPPVFSGRGDADPLIPAPLVTLTDQWLAAHTTLTRRTYRGLGHGVSAAEISDLAHFLAEQIAAPFA